MTTSIILSTGIFDLLKDHIRRRKLSKYNQEKLEQELRNARQILSKDIPADVVTVNTRVRVKELETGAEFNYTLVPPAKARNKHNTLSILSPIGVAMVGYSQGSELKWEMPEGIKAYRIEEVTRLA
ncbi:GreA/GreB family elongation factor [Pedobacter heparinus]|uniref:Transcription elongation factor n=1 Tax=Pedobacter heparinus (strain ATCC 13125 / DSM 2366 / CIP 104194 / JCM 7457 / NBRC 12017 / NCIMB 9290 / NRRL B-14731 / HIM 762-3) TaxID=485917 RepID=C6XVH8_PEDHD|nr:GreA/GreB family elongation factor [Pedobacter heparinus]ACU04044.1 Transcription elongation factor [Pedobacter heparinus DSM 2366]